MAWSNLLSNFPIVSPFFFLPETISTAEIMVASAFAKNPKFQVYFSFEGWMLANLTAGMSPVSNLGDAITQIALSGVFRFISLFYLNDFWRIIRSYKPKSGDGKKEETKKGTKAD
jgi:hypothetical protein